jgi:hypothetical protein
MVPSLKSASIERLSLERTLVTLDEVMKNVIRLKAKQKLLRPTKNPTNKAGNL